MKVTLLFADFAEAINGKLYIMGGGWSIKGAEPSPMAIAIKIEVPWDQANRRHNFQLALFDSDERPVVVPTPIGDRPFELGGNFEVGRPPGLKPGSALDVPLAINIGPVPLKAESHYLWRLS